ncbi:MAG TPA: PQQ-binding-like beta-propeller repeat protein [Acidimicrobiales bacterium]|nr:PQQ-binding-like beta-propeller repeat protein [Acidimicrobiales bacterium]
MRVDPRLAVLATAGLLGVALVGATSGAGASAAAGAARAPGRVVTPDAAPALGDLLTYDYDNGRSGDDPVDAPVANLSAGPSWNDTLDGAVFGEPLVDGPTVYVATEGDTIYALAATTGKVLWKVQTGTPVSLSIVDSAPTLGSGCGDIDPLGITGTPVIDPTSNELFAAEETLVPGAASWQHVRHFLVAVSLTTHKELWHRDIDPPRPNTADSYYIPAEQQRPAVTLAGGMLYVPLGGLDGDCGQYHGYVEAIAESGGGALRTYQVPTQREGAVWETNGLLVAPNGDLYFATGNGSSNTEADFDEGNSVVEVSPALRRLGVWAPSNWVQLNDQDWDLGSGGPIQVPGTALLFVAGKPATDGSFGYLMTEGHLGGIGHGAFTGAVCTSGGVFGADASDVIGTGAAARIVIYAACGSGTEALRVSTSPPSFHQLWAPSSGAPNGPPIVAGGLVWALAWNNSELYAMNPSTGHVVLERATASLNHFATPGAGDDLVLVPTSGGVEAFKAIG